MDILELEKIALALHNGNPINSDHQSTELADYEENMRTNVSEQIAQIRKNYPTGKIVAVDIGSMCGTAAAGLNRIEEVSGFGIDIGFESYNPKTGLPENRFIVADAESMPQIPNATFHYIISYNSLSYTDPTKSFPEIFRVLKPGGIADLDLEMWTEHIQEISNLDMVKDIALVGVYSGFKGNLRQYLEHLQELRDTDKDNKYFNYNKDCLFVRFEISKPYKPKPKK